MIFILMSKTVGFYWFVIFLSFMCHLNNALSEEPISLPVNFKGKYTSDIKNYEIVVPQRVNKDGSFISHLVSHHHSKRSTKELEFIFYKIPIGGKDYLIELTPNRKLISPGAVVETHRENVKKSENRKFLNESSNNEKIGEMFKNLDIRKLENTQCHFSGTVKGENVSKAALSTCDGLAGFIQIARGFYTIEPVAEHDPFVEDAYPHILYKTDGLENSSVCHTMGQLTTSVVDQLVRKRRESNAKLTLPKYIETLIVMDKTMINHHRGSDCENYVLTVFNMAFNLFHDASSGLMMTLTIVRIIRLEIDNDEMNLKVNADAEKTLRYFQTWQYEINPGDDSHPNHHDIAVLITRVNVCYSPSSCGLLGLTTIGKACHPKLSAALCEDSGLRLGYVIAHEIGHLLGADHDSVNSTCDGKDENGLKTVMHPHISMTSQTWSKCSRAYFKAFFGSGMGSCFLDEPEEHNFNVQDLLPGVMYNADFQCKHLIGMNARECDMGSTCDSLNCHVPGYACIVTHTPPADGTHCGENRWCHETKCLVVGERPGAVDGSWSEWSAWSDCSRSCGSGVASSMRNCDRPRPSHGGKNCVGERKRYKICAATKVFERLPTVPQNISDLIIEIISEEVNVSFVGKPCETGRPSFRDIQCGEFNDWIYPEDGKVHTWKAYFFHDDNPCTLYCINEEKQVAALRPRVVDGTMCYRGIRDICVSGICKSLPCDLHFESNAVEDACGVCHGDGTGCEFSEGTETFQKLARGLTKLVNIPSGTKNIKVEEMSPTSAKIIVRDKDTRYIYVRGKTLGMYYVPGSQAWLGMIKKNQEALHIPGPITKPLSVWIQRLENVTVKWSMALPAEQQRKPEFAWDFLRWGPCSAKCGPGTQISKPSCMEGKAGLVEDTFCADLEMPPVKVRQCEITKCVPRWMVGDWKACGQSPSEKKKRKRVVYCIKSIGEGEGESEIVPDSNCEGPKPHEEEPCENRKKREDTESNFFETDSKFRHTDTSEFGFHKKYEDYLKHFAALSVPQRNSETIPLHLVSSPHFKHYFHVLETPDDSVDENPPNGTSYDMQVQTKISPDFYKDTFSGHQIDVSHIHSGSASASENRTKKSANREIRRGKSAADNSRGLKKFDKPSKRDGKPKRKYTKFPSRSHKCRTRKKCRKKSLKNTRTAVGKFLLWQVQGKNFTHDKSDLMTVIENLGDDNYKYLYSKLIRNGGPGKLSTSEKKKLRTYHLTAFRPKVDHPKRNGFLSLFSKMRHKSSNKQKDIGEVPIESQKFLWTNNTEFDGSGFKRFSEGSEKIHVKLEKGMQEEKKCRDDPDPQSVDLSLRKGFKETQAPLIGSSSPRDKRYQWQETHPERISNDRENIDEDKIRRNVIKVIKITADVTPKTTTERPIRFTTRRSKYNRIKKPKTASGTKKSKTCSKKKSKPKSSDKKSKANSSDKKSKPKSSDKKCKPTCSGKTCNQQSSGKKSKQHSSGKKCKQQSSGKKCKQQSSGKKSKQQSSGKKCKQQSSGKKCKSSCPCKKSKSKCSNKRPKPIATTSPPVTTTTVTCPPQTKATAKRPGCCKKSKKKPIEWDFFLPIQNKEPEGSGLSVGSEKIQGEARECTVEKPIKEEKKNVDDSNPESIDSSLGKSVQETQVVLGGSSTPRIKTYEPQTKHLKERSNCGHNHKKKNKKLKERYPFSLTLVTPKSEDENFERVCQIEKNLLRHSHPTVKKPTEMKHQLEKPIIKEDVVVFHKDLLENQDMVTVSHNNEEREKQKEKDKPLQPEKNEKKLTIKNQAEVNHFQELQHREAFCRGQNDEVKTIKIVKIRPDTTPKPTTEFCRIEMTRSKPTPRATTVTRPLETTTTPKWPYCKKHFCRKNKKKPIEWDLLLPIQNRSFEGRPFQAESEEIQEETKQRAIEQPIKEEKKCGDDPENLRKGLKETQAALGASSPPRIKRYQRQTKHLKTKTNNRLHKRKTPTRIWKKPKSKDSSSKSGKEESENVLETKNNLKNLFRDSHPKASNLKTTITKKAPEMIHEKPVIKEGVLVIDKDLPENQVLDIVFDKDETEGKQKEDDKLPQPEKNEKKLTIKGQAVFQLFEQLQQRSAREASYREDDQELVSSTVLSKKCGVATATTAEPENTSTRTENTTTAEPKTKVTNRSAATDSTKCSLKSTTQAPQKKTESEKTPQTELSKPQTTKYTASIAVNTTVSTPSETDKDPDDSGDCIYDIDDVRVTDKATTERTDKKKKLWKKNKDKKGKKKKKWKLKKKKKEEDSSTEDFPEENSSKEVAEGSKAKWFHDGL